MRDRIIVGLVVLLAAVFLLLLANVRWDGSRGGYSSGLAPQETWRR